MFRFLILQPFNHPLLIAVKKIAPALAAGNSVVVKPSEVNLFGLCHTYPCLQPVFKLAPITVLEFAEMANEAGGNLSDYRLKLLRI
jgi:hypothetical protein